MLDDKDNVTLPLPSAEQPTEQPTECAAPAPSAEPRWRVLLKAAVAAGGRGGMTKAAEAMGVSRVYVSRVFMVGANRIAQPSPKFIARVLAAFGDGRVDCPHLGHDIAAPECRQFAALEWQTIRGTGPARVLHWRACQSCPQRPEQQPEQQPEVPHGPATA